MQAKNLLITGDAKVLGDLYTKDGKVATQADVPSDTEVWVFTYEDGSQETKTVYIK